MQHQRAGSLEHVPTKALELKYEDEHKIANFLFLLAGLVVDQQRWRDNGSYESRRLGQTLTDELGECMIHLIREAGKQKIDLPVVTSRGRGGRRQSVAVRNAGAADCYWVDVADASNVSDARPLQYSIKVRTYSSSDENGELQRNNANAAGGC